MNASEYHESEAAWREVTGIKVGDKVKVVSLWAPDSWHCHGYENGNRWLDYVRIGLVGEVRAFRYFGGVELYVDPPVPDCDDQFPRNRFYVPYWVLVRVEDNE